MAFPGRVPVALVGAAVAVATMLAAVPARGQGAILRILEEIGTSPAADEALEGLAANSKLLAATLEELGIKAAPDAAALGRLTAGQRGAAIGNSQTLAHLWVTAPGGDLAVVERRLAAINTLRAAGVGQTGAVPGGAGARSLLSLDLGTGDMALRKPIYLMQKGVLELKVEKFNLYKSATAASEAAAASCAMSSRCLSLIGSSLQHRTPSLGLPRVGLGELPLLRAAPTPP